MDSRQNDMVLMSGRTDFVATAASERRAEVGINSERHHTGSLTPGPAVLAEIRHKPMSTQAKSAVGACSET